MKPSIGRIVHFRSSNNEVHAGLVVFVHPNGLVNVLVFAHRDEKTTLIDYVPQSENDGVGWFWPPRI